MGDRSLALTPPNLFCERRHSQISNRLEGHNCIGNRERCDVSEVGGAEARAIEHPKRDNDTRLIRSRERKRLTVLQIAVGDLGRVEPFGERLDRKQRH